MYRNVYHADPDAETDGSFFAMVHAIPRRTKRLFGYEGSGVMEEALRDEEVDRLQRYLEF